MCANYSYQIGIFDTIVAERIANHYLVQELFCHWNFEIIHFIQLERPMPSYSGTPHRAP